MMKKVLALFVMAAMLLTLVAVPAMAEEQVTIKFSNWDGGETLDAYNTAIAKFEELHPNIKIEMVNIPSEYDTKLTAMIAGGTAPDVAILESSTIAFTLAEEGKVYNLYELQEADPTYAEHPILETLAYNWAPDKRMGYALGPQVVCLYYSKPALEAAGVKPAESYEDAWTWDQFVENAKLLTLDNQGRNANDPAFDVNNVVQWGCTVPTWYATGYSVLMGSQGADYTNADGTALAIFDDPAMADSIQKLADLIYVHHVAPSPSQSSSMPGMVDAFATGAYAMNINGHWNNLNLMTEGVDYDLMPVPKTDKPFTRLMGGCLSILSSTQHPKEAWEFYKFMADPENTLSMIDNGLWMPMSTEWYTNPELIAKWAQTEGHPAHYVPVVVEGMLKYAQPLWQFNVKNFPKMEAIIGPALDTVWLGERTAAEALASVKDQVIPLFEGRYDK
jgi:multiple sugar transport system substrate-binding protein